LGNSIAGRVGVISAYGTVVIAWGYHCCTDGSGTDAYAYTAAHIGSAIGAAAITGVDAADANTARTSTASIRQRFSRNARDAQDGSSSNGNYSSIRHGVSSSRVS
jgi:hypothetical protein